MSQAQVQGSALKNADVLMVVDGESLEKFMINNGKSFSTDINNPFDIYGTDAKKFQFLIAANDFVGNNQATSDLVLRNLTINDTVSFRGTTIDGNSDYAVIIYDVKYFSGEQVLDNLMNKYIERNLAVFPRKQENPLKPVPPVEVKQNSKFVRFAGDIVRTGKELYNIHFALYKTSSKDSNDQQLLGYFKYDPSIEVK